MVVAASVVYLYVNSYVFAAVFIVDVGHMTSSGEPGSGGESSTLDSRSTPGCSVAVAGVLLLLVFFVVVAAGVSLPRRWLLNPPRAAQASFFYVYQTDQKLI